MNEQSEEAKSFVGGRLESSEGLPLAAVDVHSSYRIAVDVPELPQELLADVVAAGKRLLEPVMLDESSTLPPVPEGVVEAGKPEARGPRPEEEENEPSEGVEPPYRFEGEPPVLRILGSSLEDEISFVSPEESLSTFGEVMVQVVDAALEGDGEPLTGHGLAQIFARGDVEDDRVQFLLLLLAQNQPITGELVLLAARAQGYEDLVDGALLAREEILRAGDVSVEQLSQEGWQPAEAAASSKQQAASSGEADGGQRTADDPSGSGSEPRASSLEPRAAESVEAVSP